MNGLSAISSVEFSVMTMVKYDESLQDSRECIMRICHYHHSKVVEDDLGEQLKNSSKFYNEMLSDI